MTPWVTRLLIANAAVFFIQMTAPLLVRAFVFVPAAVLIRPWTIVTYMFLHGGFAHIAFNMLALFFFGPRVESRIGSRRFFVLYFLSGISGALLSFLFAPYAAVIGASAGVFGVMLAFAYFWPRERILIWGIIPVEARILVLVTTALALFGGFSGGRGGGIAHFAHLGGYVGAFLYLRWLDHMQGAKRFRRQAAPRVARDALSNWKRVDPQSVHEVNRDEVNRILDKISHTGVDSLSPQERAFLLSFVPPDDRPVS